MGGASELSKRRQSEARRVAESKATIPHLQVRAEAEVGPALEGPVLEATVVAACGSALREHPLLNGSYRDGKLEEHSRVNVAVAMDADDGPVRPTIADADGKSPEEIREEIESMRGRAESGEITAPELSGATFTVASLDSSGAREFEAVIVPPQAGILALGPAAERPAVRDGAVVPARLVTLTLGCDARLVSAATGAAFLASVKEELER